MCVCYIYEYIAGYATSPAGADRLFQAEYEVLTPSPLLTLPPPSATLPPPFRPPHPRGSGPIMTPCFLKRRGKRVFEQLLQNKWVML